MSIATAIIVGVVVGLIVGRVLIALVHRFSAQPFGQPDPSGAYTSAGDLMLWLATPVAFATVAWWLRDDPRLIAYAVFAAAALALTAIDLREMRLPREISYPAALLGLAGLISGAALDGDWSRLRSALIGAVIAVVVLGLVHLISRGGFGDGDVRLAPLIGLFLGDRGLAMVPIGLMVSFVLAAVVAIIVLASGRLKRHDSIPFGPFLLAGTALTFAVGNQLYALITP